MNDPLVSLDGVEGGIESFRAGREWRRKESRGTPPLATLGRLLPPPAAVTTSTSCHVAHPLSTSTRLLRSDSSRSPVHQCRPRRTPNARSRSRTDECRPDRNQLDRSIHDRRRCVGTRRIRYHPSSLPVEALVPCWVSFHAASGESRVVKWNLFAAAAFRRRTFRLTDEALLSLVVEAFENGLDVAYTVLL